MLSQSVIGAAMPLGTMLYYAILFIILLYLIKVFAWKPLNKVLQERTNKITNDIDTAAKSKKNAQDLADRRQKALDKSHDQATGIISDAKNAGQKQHDKIVQSAGDDVQNMKKSAKRDIEQERQDTLAGTKNDVADLSIQIASKIIQKELKSEDQKDLINSYIEGLGKHNAR